MKANNQLPEQAILTGEADKIQCNNCYNEYLFHLRCKDTDFSLGLIDVLKCLKFAEKQGAVPELPDGWWLAIEHKFYRLEGEMEDEGFQA